MQKKLNNTNLTPCITYCATDNPNMCTYETYEIHETYKTYIKSRGFLVFPTHEIYTFVSKAWLQGIGGEEYEKKTEGVA